MIKYMYFFLFFFPFCKLLGGQMKHRKMRRGRWREKRRERSVNGGDGMRGDFALLRVILCLLKIFSYMTCASLHSPLHQVRLLSSSDSRHRAEGLEDWVRTHARAQATKRRDERERNMKSEISVWCFHATEVSQGAL